jgi:hypothetical protein
MPAQVLIPGLAGNSAMPRAQLTGAMQRPDVVNARLAGWLAQAA